ncbi:MAG TPA: ubiquinol-cytochrome c reductase iron-sulfur subunit [Tepidisphaeraceae bacterium]|nr:ubiquinol-cytochrome c reductase iron-sulfur subunit [Tepidisphaeraceae bacterium]
MSDQSHHIPPSSPPTRRRFTAALTIAWGVLAASGSILLLILRQFLTPNLARQPRRLWRVGKLRDFLQPSIAYEQFKQTPDGTPGFWVVNLQPTQPKLVAVSTLCTHLGCIANWQPADQTFRCPCHGSAYDLHGVNFQGPAPRPLERHAISLDPSENVLIDQTTVFRRELRQWENTDSFIPLQ